MDQVISEVKSTMSPQSVDTIALLRGHAATLKGLANAADALDKAAQQITTLEQRVYQAMEREKKLTEENKRLVQDAKTASENVEVLTKKLAEYKDHPVTKQQEAARLAKQIEELQNQHRALTESK